MSEHPPVGIDLGTTYSLVAGFDAGGARVLRDVDGSALLPSAVAIDDAGRLLVGAPARDRWLAGRPGAVVRFKPEMGGTKRFDFGGSRWTPTALSALLLRELRERASRALSVDVTEVVLTVPAWFREPQRRATLDAAVLAGLRVRRLLNEPTAAALAYGLAVPDDTPKVIAVLDLGGGTFDITLVEAIDGVVDVRASVGDTHLGGEDFTDVMLGLLRTAGGVPAVGAGLSPLRAAAEQAKRQLTSADVARVTLPEPFGEAEVRRERFEAASADLLRRVERCAREALMQAGLRPAGVDEVVLVGGASRMPCVQAAAAAVFGQRPRLAEDVDTVVALGAAIQAALIQRHQGVRERSVCDVLTHSLGVAVRQVWGERVYQGRFSPVLHRGTSLPASRTERFSSVDAGQTTVVVEVYEGEAREVIDNIHIGAFTVSGLPVYADPERRAGFDVRFTQDLSGLLQVEAHVLETDARVAAVFERGATALDDNERETALQAIARLSTHPRDLLPNRVLLERAGALITVIGGGQRTLLDAALLRFEAALDAGEPDRMVAARDALRALVSAYVQEYQLDWLEE